MRLTQTGFIGLLLPCLVCSVVSGQDLESIKPRFEVIVRTLEEARSRYHRDLQGKTTAESMKPAIEAYTEAVSRNTEAILDLVRANPKDPVGVEALQYVIDRARAGPSSQSYRAMEILLRNHSRDSGMGDVCARLIYFSDAPIAETLIREVLENHPNRDVRGSACYSLALYLKGRSRWFQRLRENPSAFDQAAEARKQTEKWRTLKNVDLEALERETEAVLERIVREFADVRIKLDADTIDPRPLGVIAEGEMFALRNLTVGKVAPEISGQDDRGEAFSSKDHRGKVVVLTFSGNWCGPCVAMYPEQRELTAMLKDRPFAILSVNTDRDAATLRKSIDSGDVTWRCWWDGGIEGPITTRWGITAFPSIFVLDRSGVIRFKDVRGEELKRAIMSLLDDPGRPSSPSPVQ